MAFTHKLKHASLAMTLLPDDLVKHLAGYFATNCFKTICGAGFIGWGVARLKRIPNETDNKKNDENDGAFSRFEREHILGSMIVGFGLFLTIPSLGSQWLLEAVAPIVTSSAVVSEFSQNNFIDYLRSWRPTTDLWRQTSSGAGGNVTKFLPIDQNRSSP